MALIVDDKCMILLTPKCGSSWVKQAVKHSCKRVRQAKPGKAAQKGSLEWKLAKLGHYSLDLMANIRPELPRITLHRGFLHWAYSVNRHRRTHGFPDFGWVFHETEGDDPETFDPENLKQAYAHVELLFACKTIRTVESPRVWSDLAYWLNELEVEFNADKLRKYPKVNTTEAIK